MGGWGWELGSARFRARHCERSSEQGLHGLCSQGTCKLMDAACIILLLLLLLIYFLLKDNCFTEFCCVLSNLSMNQP